jgi:hypothetical protein
MISKEILKIVRCCCCRCNESICFFTEWLSNVNVSEIILQNLREKYDIDQISFYLLTLFCNHHLSIDCDHRWNFLWHELSKFLIEDIEQEETVVTNNK